MITIAEFLYLDTIDETQSRGILNDPKYANLSFRTPNEFREFFSSEGIRLRKETIGTRTERELLLERFKSFRGSTDYLIARKYVEEQFNLKNRLREIQSSQPNVETIISILNDITSPPSDPFFNFIIRKILTGSENGVLPSEDLRNILDRLIEENSREYYDESSNIVRDSQDIIESYQNIFKNKGRLRVPISDERFLSSDFRYIIDTSFQSLPDAVSAEENIFRLITEAQNSDQQTGNNDSIRNLLSELSNLVDENSNSVAGLRARISTLEEAILLKDSIIEGQIEAEERIQDNLVALAEDSAQKSATIETLETVNKNLQTQIDTTLTELQENISSQINNVTSAIDTLSQSVVGSANAANAAQDEEINDLKTKLRELESLLSQLKNSSGNGGGGTGGGNGGSTPVGGGDITEDNAGIDPKQPAPSS